MRFVLAILLGLTLNASAQMGFMQTRIAATNLVGWWTFNEGSGTVSTADLSGRGNTAFLTNSPAWTNGIAGSALRFNGVSTFLSLGTNIDFPAGSSLTLCAWVRCEANNTSSFQGIIAKRPSSPSYQFGLNFNNTTFQVYTTGSSGVQAFSYALPTNTWVHVVGVFSATSATAFYTNGVLFGTLGSGGGISGNTGGYTMIGSSINGNTEPFAGTIDDVRIYNRALTATEISQLYNNGRGTQR